MDSNESTALHILLVEDSEHDWLAFRRVLQKSGLPCEITRYARAEKALERLRSDASSFDLLVTDYKLPGISGLALCRELLDRAVPLPLVLMTGAGTEHLAVEALKAGVDDYVAKDPDGSYLDLLPVVLPDVVRRYDDRLARQRAEEELRRRNRELALLNRLSWELTVTLDSQRVIRQLLQGATEIVGAEGASIWRVVEERERALVCQALFHQGQHRSTIDLRLRPGQGIAGWVVQHGESVMVPYAPDDPRFFPDIDELTGLRTVSLLGVPLRVRGQVIGMLEVTNRLAGDYDIDDLALVEMLAAPAAIAIENARLYEEAQQEIAERVRAEEELKRHRDHLEDLVQERTADLIVAKEQALEARRIAENNARVAEAAQSAAEAANLAKSAFLASVSHELRTPLNAILGYAQLLQRRPLEADVIDALQIVQQSGEHLLTLIDDILTISKTETGRMKLHPSQIHFPNFLERIAGIIHARAAAKGLTFNFERLNTLPTWVKADETRLRQVLLSLLDNAVKFTEQGEVVLSVRVCEHGSEAPAPPHPSKASPWDHTITLRFSVRDTGIGISPDHLKRLFQPFEQAEDVTRWTKGAGLGLAISRRLVRLMGGELQVESPPSVPPAELDASSPAGGGEVKGGPGSTFWFEVALPVMEVAREATPPPWDRSRAKPARGTAPLVPPPQAELAVLLDLALRGDMQALQERAAHIETLGEQHVPFASKLRELARGFEDGQILALVRRYLNAKDD